MLEILTDEVSKCYKRKIWYKIIIKKNIYAQVKRSHYEHHSQVHMYAFKYVDLETMT